jgi:hypothetical protein
MKIVKQQGSALIVSLIMLTSVTFLAILSLQGSTTQIRIVSNLQIKEDMFHTSKRELSTQYDNYLDDVDKANSLFDAYQGSVLQTVASLTPEIPVNTDEVSAVDSTLESLEATPVYLNFSFAKNSSVGELSTMKFELSSNVTDKSERFHSQQKLGFNYYVPSTGR